MNGFFLLLVANVNGWFAFDPNMILKAGDFVSMLEGRWCLAYCCIITYIMQSLLVQWGNGEFEWFMLTAKCTQLIDGFWSVFEPMASVNGNGGLYVCFH